MDLTLPLYFESLRKRRKEARTSKTPTLNPLFLKTFLMTSTASSFSSSEGNEIRHFDPLRSVRRSLFWIHTTENYMIFSPFCINSHFSVFPFVGGKEVKQRILGDQYAISSYIRPLSKELTPFPFHVYSTNKPALLPHSNIQLTILLDRSLM